MAKKVYLETVAPFTRRIGDNLVVGHPKHRDPRGRFHEVDEGPAAAALIASGKVKPTTRQKFLDAVGELDADAGQVRIDQLAGKRGNVSITMSNEALAREAQERGVDISKAKSRNDVVKLINGHKTDVSSEAEAELPTQTAGRDTADTTNHPVVSSPQNAIPVVIGAGQAVQGGAEEGVVDADDEAPAGGEGSGSNGK